MNLTIGLTGGIGSGKSTVAQILKDLGSFIISADNIAKNLLEPHKEGYLRIIEIFGNNILQNNLEINRKLLAEILFQNDEKRNELNKILHPLIAQKRNQILENIDNAVVVNEIPLLVENKLYFENHLNIVVVSSLQNKFKRLTTNRKMTEKEITNRINSQLDDYSRSEYANIVIENNLDIDTLVSNIKTVWNSRIIKFYNNLNLNSYSNKFYRNKFYDNQIELFKNKFSNKITDQFKYENYELTINNTHFKHEKNFENKLKDFGFIFIKNHRYIYCDPNLSLKLNVK